MGFPRRVFDGDIRLDVRCFTRFGKPYGRYAEQERQAEGEEAEAAPEAGEGDDAGEGLSVGQAGGADVPA